MSGCHCNVTARAGKWPGRPLIGLISAPQFGYQGRRGGMRSKNQDNNGNEKLPEMRI